MLPSFVFIANGNGAGLWFADEKDKTRFMHESFHKSSKVYHKAGQRGFAALICIQSEIRSWKSQRGDSEGKPGALGVAYQTSSARPAPPTSPPWDPAPSPPHALPVPVVESERPTEPLARGELRSLPEPRPVE